jgi:DNA-directed RNA polymerase specialized sigma24 family protein
LIGLIVRNLETLREEERETIIEHIYGELTFREIAEMREVALSTVTTWYRRGLERLRARMKEE